MVGVPGHVSLRDGILSHSTGNSGTDPESLKSGASTDDPHLVRCSPSPQCPTTVSGVETSPGPPVVSGGRPGPWALLPGKEVDFDEDCQGTTRPQVRHDPRGVSGGQTWDESDLSFNGADGRRREKTGEAGHSRSSTAREGCRTRPAQERDVGVGPDPLPCPSLPLPPSYRHSNPTPAVQGVESPRTGSDTEQGSRLPSSSWTDSNHHPHSPASSLASFPGRADTRTDQG